MKARQPPPLEALALSRPWDLAVVGAGIHGSWLARHAARAGLSVVIIDKEDVAAGTTSRSTMLAHGGLRYLAQREFGLVREALQERGALTRMAPHLVRPIPFLMPFYREAPHPPWKLRIGLRMYTHLARGSGYPKHRILSRDEVIAREPTIRPEGLRGGALFFDGQILSPERLALEVLMDGADHGALFRNHTAVVEALDSNGRITGLRLRDGLTDDEVDIQARCVVNATGPWLDRFAPLAQGPPRLRLTKGVHLMTPVFSRHAIVVAAPDGRTFFTIPWHEHELVGTTDTDYEADPDMVHTTADDVRYLVEATREYFPDAPLDDVRVTNAGLRNLVRVDGSAPSDVTRQALIVDHEADGLAGLHSVLGGKMTTARATAARILRTVCRSLDLLPPDPPVEEPLPGGVLDVGTAAARAARWATNWDLPGAVGTHLVHLLGSRWSLVTDRPPRRLCDHGPTIARQLDVAVRQEWARTPLDLLRRRTVAWATPCRGAEGLDRAVDAVAAVHKDDDDALEAMRKAAKDDMALHSLWHTG